MTMKKGWLIALAAVLVLSVAKDQAARVGLEVVASKLLGTRVQVGGVSLGVLSQSVRIRNLRVWNPSGFPKETLLVLPVIEAAGDVPALLKGTVHLRQARVELQELALITNAEGQLNVDALRVTQSSKAPPAPDAGRASRALRIDVLTLRIGRIVTKDYAASATPAVTVRDIQRERTYRNITSPEQLAVFILVEPMKAGGIQGAAIYGAAALTGVGIIPVAAAAIFAGKDRVEQAFEMPADALWNRCRTVLSAQGTVTKEDAAAGTLTADVRGVRVTVAVRSTGPAASRVTISARQFMLPKPAVASGILYEVERAGR